MQENCHAPIEGQTESTNTYSLHILSDKLDVSLTVNANAMLFCSHFAVLSYHKLLGVPTGLADEFEATFALVDPVELAEC